MSNNSNVNQYVRYVKRNWQASIGGIISLFAILIAGGWYIEEVPNEIPITLIAIAAPSIFYFYSEWLDRPMISVKKMNQPISVAPMFANVEEINTVGSRSLRPAIFYRLEVENNGKATAENCMVHLCLIPRDEKSQPIEYYGRWSNPENSDRYNILPGQSRELQILKIFLTNDFFPTSDRDVDRSGYGNGSSITVVRPPGNPSGKVRAFSDVDRTDIEFYPYYPREKGPEREETSIHGGWEGHNLFNDLESLDTKFSIEARLIAENYKTEWVVIADEFTIFEGIEEIEDDQVWQNQWEFLGDLKQDFCEASLEWLRVLN